MTIQVKLQDIIEEMEMQSEESRSFINSKTGEIVAATAEDLAAAEDDEPLIYLSGNVKIDCSRWM